MGRLRMLLCGLVMVLGSCSVPDPPLRVGLLLWPPYELTVMAQREGWYPEGSVRILEYQSPILLSRAFRSGQVDVALTTSHISLSLAQDGIDHRIIYVVDHSLGGDALVARPGILSLDELAGRAVGVEPSPLGMYVFGRVLSHAGLEQEEVTTTVAEFVENEAIRGSLSRIGVDLCQGFGIAPPGPLSELLDRQ